MNGLGPTGPPAGGSGGMLGERGSATGAVPATGSGDPEDGETGDSTPTSTGRVTVAGIPDTTGSGRGGWPWVGGTSTTASPFGPWGRPACGRSERRYASP